MSWPFTRSKPRRVIITAGTADSPSQVIEGKFIKGWPTEAEIRAMFPAQEGFGRTTQMYSQAQLDDIRAHDRETIAKQVRAYMAERTTPCNEAADHLAGFIRGGA